MSDQCRHCTSRGDLDTCLNTDCSRHEDWWAVEILGGRNKLHTEISRLRDLPMNFRATHEGYGTVTVEHVAEWLKLELDPNRHPLCSICRTRHGNEVKHECE